MSKAQRPGGPIRNTASAGRLLAGASLLTLAAMMAPGVAFAQAAQPATAEREPETVVVTGIRSSLKSAQDIKRVADVVVDSVTAEDIGALPDRSVTEALQRVPGVVINRFAASVDPDHFSVEGSGVVVRGLTFVRSELNGRDTFTANNGRALSFADVPSELLAGVDVFKSPSADMIEGGISGTVNLRTRLPFDQKRLLAGSLEYSYGDFAKEWAPSVSLIASDSWDTSVGRFGVMANFVNSKLTTRSDGTQASNFGCRTSIGGQAIAGATANCDLTGATNNPGVFFPRGAAFRSQTTERERQGIAFAAQWRSNDDKWLATAQFLRSDSSQSWTEHAVEVATDNVQSNGDSQPVGGTTFGFDSRGIFTNGVITGPQGWRDDQLGGRDNRTPQFGLQSNNIRRDVEQENVTSDFGINLRWTPNDRLGVRFDYQHVDSTVKNTDVGIWGSTFQNLDLRLNGDSPPTFTFLPPSQNGTVPNCPQATRTDGADCPAYFNGTPNGFSDPFNSFFRSAMDHVEDSEGTEDAFRADIDYAVSEDGFIRTVRAGVRWAERDNVARFSRYNWGVLSEIWGGGGPVWFSDRADGMPNPDGVPGTAGNVLADQTALFAFNNFFRGEVPNPNGGQPRPFVNFNLAQNYDRYAALGLLIGDEWRARLGGNGCPQNWVPVALRCGAVDGGPFLADEINPINEVTSSAYAMVRFEKELEGGGSFSGNFGLRYIKTERSAGGAFSLPLQSQVPNEADCTNPRDPTAPPTAFCELSASQRAAVRAFSNGATVEDTANFEYDYVLPSLNVRWEVREGLQFRLGLSKSISLPELGLTRNFFQLAFNTGGSLTDQGDGLRRNQFSGTAGNPRLKPIESTNIDLTAEWYFSPVGSLTLSGFHKTLEGVISNGSVRTSFTNAGQTFTAVVTSPANSEDEGKVKGFELAYQQTYDFLPGALSGLGVQASYTWIDSQGVSQSTLSATDPDVAAGRVANIDTTLLPLQGLSKHNVNFAAFWENEKLSARLAYNWRSEFLLTARDVIVPFAPIMNEATGQLDGSIFYTLNENWKIGLQGANLTNEITQTSQVLNNQLLRTGRSWFMNDRRYTLVARATF